MKQLLRHRPLRHAVLHWERVTSPVRIVRRLVQRDLAQLEQIRRLVTTPPVVVGGCGRSGTSLLMAALSCHPHLCALERETSAYVRDAFADANPDLDFPFALYLLWDRLLRQPVPREATRLCEKTPKNVVQFRRILDHYGEGVRLLHIVRDGRDVVLSRHPTDKSRYWVSPERWVHDVRKGLEVDDDPRVHRFRYEDLVSDFEPTMRGILAHIGEPWVEALHHFPYTAAVQTYRAWDGPLSPLSTASVGKWRRPENAARARELEAHPGAKELLAELGYPLD